MTKAIETAIKLLETLPEPAQVQLVEELRRLALEVNEEARWEKLFAQSDKLKAAAVKARQEIVAGKSSDFDFDKL